MQLSREEMLVFIAWPAYLCRSTSSFLDMLVRWLWRCISDGRTASLDFRDVRRWNLAYDQAMFVYQ
jgi:hypothetical protein